MDLKYLSYFVALFRKGNYLQAALDLEISQSQLSKVVRAMESEFGVLLVDRSRRRITFTPEGEKLAIGASEILGAWNRLTGSIKKDGRGGELKLRILSPPVLSAYGLHRLFTAFRAAHPDILLTVEETEALEIPGELTAGRADLGVMREMFVDRTVFDFRKWANDEVVAVVPADHSLAKRKKIDLTDLSGDDFLFPGPQTLLLDYYSGLCRSAGFHPRVVHTGRHMDDLLSLTASGAGVALMMAAFVRHLRPKGVSVLRFRRPDASSVGFLTLRNRPQDENPALGEFLTFAGNAGPVKKIP